MKKILSYSLVAAILFSINSAAFAQINTINIASRGRISPNNENENNEADPVFKPIAFSVVTPKKRGDTQSNQKKLSEMENGIQLVQDILNRMMNNEYGFELLSSHKYMINNCLGFKVSAGSFNLRFNSPYVAVSPTGKLTVKLSVDEIKFSAFKLRMRPCSKVEHLPDPCHFGPKFEVGGEATNLSVTATFDPVAVALASTDMYCYLTIPGGVDIKWKIGGLNLKPMQNNLDDLGRAMVEDALNGGMVVFFYRHFMDMWKKVSAEYFPHCQNAYNITNVIDQVQTVVANNPITDPTDGNNNNNNNNNDATTTTDKWVITPVATMRGAMGRLSTQFPEGVVWSVDIRSGEDKFLTNRSSASKHGTTHELPPGTYNFKLNTVPVQGVPIEKGKETRLKYGILNIVSNGNWHIYDSTQKKYYTSGTKPKRLAIPVGSYQLKFGGAFMTVVVKDGEEVEL